jgi:hypothetical protein
LSSIARNFDKYKFTSLAVAFVSGQATSMPGKVGLGIDYDPLDAPPANRVEFFTLTAHTEAAPWDNLVLNIPCKGGFRFTDQSVESNLRLVDMGQLLIMNDLASADSVLGDLIVSYSVELTEPQPKSSDIYCMRTRDQFPFLSTTHTSHSFVKWSEHYTSVNEYFTVPMGFYAVLVCSDDVTSHTLNLELRSGDGDGYQNVTAVASAQPHAFGVVHMTKHEGEVKILSSMTFSTIGECRITVTRIDNATYDLLLENMTAMSTY